MRRRGRPRKDSAQPPLRRMSISLSPHAWEVVDRHVREFGINKVDALEGIVRRFDADPRAPFLPLDWPNVPSGDLAGAVVRAEWALLELRHECQDWRTAPTPDVQVFTQQVAAGHREARARGIAVSSLLSPDDPALGNEPQESAP